MTPAVLRAWYEKMLDRAEELGIVSNVNSLQKEVAHLRAAASVDVLASSEVPIIQDWRLATCLRHKTRARWRADSSPPRRSVSRPRRLDPGGARVTASFTSPR